MHVASRTPRRHPGGKPTRYWPSRSRRTKKAAPATNGPPFATNSAQEEGPGYKLGMRNTVAGWSSFRNRLPRGSARVAMGACWLALGALAGGCIAPMTPLQRMQDAANDLTTATRFGRMDMA